jgi:hypothetical protein
MQAARANMTRSTPPSILRALAPPSILRASPTSAPIRRRPSRLAEILWIGRRGGMLEP